MMSACSEQQNLDGVAPINSETSLSFGNPQSPNGIRPCFRCSDAPKGTIFCDDFEKKAPLTERYFEYNSRNGSFVRAEGVGVDGTAGMRVRFEKGQVNAGDFKKSIGRSSDPYLQGTSSRPDKNFTDIYWRIDVRYQDGWIGGGADKLSRATTLLDGWKQGMIAHVWSGGSASSHNYLVIDPASGIDEEGNIVSTRYNDFDNLRWLGNRKRNHGPVQRGKCRQVAMCGSACKVEYAGRE